MPEFQWNLADRHHYSRSNTFEALPYQVVSTMHWRGESSTKLIAKMAFNLAHREFPR
jgi:hypothetical protein